MQNAVAIMVEAGKTLRVLNDAVGTFDRKRTGDVIAAYATLVRLDEADDPTPAFHADWIDKLNLHTGVHVFPREDVARLCNEMELHGRVTLAREVVGIPFDAARHALVCTQPSVLSYLDGNPDAVLGAHARVVSPHFKCAIAWWM